MPDCKSVSIKDFNNFGAVMAVDMNGNATVDPADVFVLNDRSGQKKLAFQDWRIQAIHRSLVQQCEEAANKPARRAALAGELGVTLGSPRNLNRCLCESVGVYSTSGQYLFDVHSKGFTFRERELAVEIARGLQKPIPQRFRAPLTMDAGVEEMLKKYRFRLNRDQEQIEFPDPAKKLQFTGDARDGLNLSVRIERLNDHAIKITFRQGNGVEGFGTIDLATGDFQQG